MKLELRHIAGYLPYSLKMQLHGNYPIKLGEDNIITDYQLLSIDKIKRALTDSNFKPILRPMSDLNKEIKLNGVSFRPFYQMRMELHHEINQTDFKCCLNEKLVIENESESKYDVLRFSLYELEKLYAWHFDVHDLISTGLAIDINTL